LDGKIIVWRENIQANGTRAVLVYEGRIGNSAPQQISD